MRPQSLCMKREHDVEGGKGEMAVTKCMTFPLSFLHGLMLKLLSPSGGSLSYLSEMRMSFPVLMILLLGVSLSVYYLFSFHFRTHEWETACKRFRFILEPVREFSSFRSYLQFMVSCKCMQEVQQSKRRTRMSLIMSPLQGGQRPS